MVVVAVGARYCAVEGNSGSGKTLTAEALSRTWDQPGYIGEYFHYFRPLSITMPDLPPPNVVVGRAQSVAWATVDRHRYADLRSLPCGAYPVVLDTTVLSVLACEMAKREAGEASAVAEIAAEYRRLLADGIVWPPEFWVFLEASYDELERRIAERGGSRPFLRRREIAAYLQAFRGWFAEHYLADREALRLSSDTSQVEEIVAAVTAHADNRSSPGAGTGLRRLLDDLARDAARSPPRVLPLNP